jgi:3',5'-cyclic AMP phosphodiesterase CpdA
MAFRLAQISDAHLSRARPVFNANFARAAEEIRAWKPDLMVATGDLSLDGADSDDDLLFAESEHARIGADWVAIPGNHDVGEEPLLGPRQPADPLRIARWSRIHGSHGFVRDIPGWRLIGYDTQSLTAAPSQWGMLEDAIRTANGRRIALFQHKPLVEERLSDGQAGYWPLWPAHRARLLSIFEERPALVASGHLHQWRDRVADGIRQVWAPSTGFVVGSAWQWSWGERRLGWVEHLFHADGTHECHLRETPNLILHDLGTMPEIYGPQRPLELPAVAVD